MSAKSPAARAHEAIDVLAKDNLDDPMVFVGHIMEAHAALDEALRAEKVRVLEEVRRENLCPIDAKWIDDMLKEARAEGASEKVDGRLGAADALAKTGHRRSETRVSNPARPPSEEPSHDWPGSDRFTPSHLRKEPEAGGGRCSNCGEAGPHFVPPGPLGESGFYSCKRKERGE